MTNGQLGLIKAYEPNGLYERYFDLAKSKFKNKNVKFLIFVGGQRFNEDNSEDFKWCRNFFKGDEFVFSEGQNEMEDLCRIISCDHNILSHASSFGWWGAWLGETNANDKVVAAPEIWFGPGHTSFNPKDIIPDRWLKL